MWKIMPLRHYYCTLFHIYTVVVVVVVFVVIAFSYCITLCCCFIALLLSAVRHLSSRATHPSIQCNCATCHTLMPQIDLHNFFN